MFRGNCQTRLDDKGRLKVPADFKHEIDRTYDDQFYITSRDGKVIQLYPMKEWEAIEAKADAAPTSNQAVQRFLNTTSLYGQVLVMDNQGRLTISERLRSKFGLKGEVAVVGKLRLLEIRDWAEFEAAVEGNLPTPEDQDELARLGI
jgi:MraZ protein